MSASRQTVKAGRLKAAARRSGIEYKWVTRHHQGGVYVNRTAGCIILRKPSKRL